MRIGIDIMGGDFYPKAPTEGAIEIHQKAKGRVIPVLIGDEEIVRAELTRQGANPSDFEIYHTSEFIGMHESPARAITAKPDSSINIGMKLIRDGHISAFVGAGNTGAMLVASSLSMGNIPGVARSTIGALFRNRKNSLSILLDIGANVDARPEYLAQFAMLGSFFMEFVLHIPTPKVALLNVGEEKGKGTQTVKDTYEILSNTPSINFVGNAEGRDLYSGHADVYVCDGFTGNIVLKFAESMYEILKERYGNDSFLEAFNFENYGGVPVLGVNGVVMIGHGISTGKAIANMVIRAAEAVESDLTGKVTKAFAEAVTN